MLLERIQLEPGETLIRQTRRHWFVIVAELTSIGFLALVPPLALFGLLFVGQNYIAVTEKIMLLIPELTFVYIVWLLMLWLQTFTIWTNYYLDVLFITNRRIIIVNQKGFFHRTVASFRLERLQDIDVEINGLLATLLDFGTLHAETAGHGEEEFRAVAMPHPRDLKGEILRAADNLMTTSSNHNTEV